MAYIKIDSETFEETQPNKRFQIKEINDQIDQLQSQKTNFGLILDGINAEIQRLRDVKNALQAL
jgi:hypothetical protein